MNYLEIKSAIHTFVHEVDCECTCCECFRTQCSHVVNKAKRFFCQNFWNNVQLEKLKTETNNSNLRKG